MLGLIIDVYEPKEAQSLSTQSPGDDLSSDYQMFKL